MDDSNDKAQCTFYPNVIDSIPYPSDLLCWRDLVVHHIYFAIYDIRILFRRWKRRRRSRSSSRRKAILYFQSNEWIKGEWQKKNHIYIYLIYMYGILSGEKERNERKKNKWNEKRHGKDYMFCEKMSKPKRNETEIKNEKFIMNEALSVCFSNRNENEKNTIYIFIHENSFYSLAVFSFVWLLIAILFYRETVSVRLTSVCEYVRFLCIWSVYQDRLSACVCASVWQTIIYPKCHPQSL